MEIIADGTAKLPFFNRAVSHLSTEWSVGFLQFPFNIYLLFKGPLRKV